MLQGNFRGFRGGQGVHSTGQVNYLWMFRLLQLKRHIRIRLKQTYPWYISIMDHANIIWSDFTLFLTHHIPLWSQLSLSLPPPPNWSHDIGTIFQRKCPNKYSPFLQLFFRSLLSPSHPLLCESKIYLTRI